MTTLGINKPVPFPLAIISVEDTSTHTAGQAPLLTGLGIDRSIAFQRPGKQKRPRKPSTAKMNVRNKKKQKSSTDKDSDADGQDVRSLQQTPVKEEQEIIDVDHGRSDVPNSMIKKAYQVLRKEQNGFVYFSTCHYKDL